MSELPPGVIIFHGEDEFGIAQKVAEIEATLGDPSTAMLNIARLDGRSLSMEELSNSARAMPFLASRRLVVVSQACQRLSGQSQRDAFKKVLDNLPDSTQLVLVENQNLPGNHWLIEWAKGAGGKAAVRVLPLKKGQLMARWIQEQAKGMGGQFTQEAATLLASIVGDESRAAFQEVQKLLTYVGNRPVQIDDVNALSASPGDATIFELVDALGHEDGKKASRALRLLLIDQDPLQIFQMIVRQIRLLILTRETLDSGGGALDIVHRLHVANFVAEKLLAQARHFSLDVLEMVYHKLANLDEGIKTGLYDGDVALETFVLGFTSRDERGSH